MKIESVKNLNITLLFSAPLNHNNISQQKLLESFQTGDAQRDVNNFIAAPGIKVIVFPNQQKDIIFEANRILLNEKSGKNPENSNLVIDLEKIISGNFFGKEEEINAYGFNYEITAVPDKDDFQVEDLISGRIAKIKKIKSAGVSFVFDENNARRLVKIKPLEGARQEFSVSLNIHYSKKDLPSFDDLKKELIAGFSEFKELIAKI